MGTRLLKFGGIRLVVNQLTFPVMKPTRVLLSFYIPLCNVRLSYIMDLMYEHRDDTLCNLSACVCD